MQENRISDDNSTLEEDFDAAIDRVVPASEAELMGLASLKNGTLLLELGYIKNIERHEIVIDVRKKLPEHMARDLYDRLKEIFESQDNG